MRLLKGEDGACFHSYCLESVVSGSFPLSLSASSVLVWPCLLYTFLPLDFSKDSFRMYFFLRVKKKNWNFSLCSSLFFLSVDLFLKEKGTTVILSLCLSLLFQLSADFFFHLSLLSLPLSLFSSVSLSLSFRCGASGRQTGGV